MKFFNLQIKVRRRMNRITRLKDMGECFKDEQEVKDHILQYFQSIFAGGTVCYDQVLDLIPNGISREDNDLLCAPFLNEEFRNTLF